MLFVQSKGFNTITARFLQATQRTMSIIRHYGKIQQRVFNLYDMFCTNDPNIQLMEMRFGIICIFVLELWNM